MATVAEERRPAPRPGAGGIFACVASLLRPAASSSLPPTPPGPARKGAPGLGRQRGTWGLRGGHVGRPQGVEWGSKGRASLPLLPPSFHLWQACLAPSSLGRCPRLPFFWEGEMKATFVPHFNPPPFRFRGGGRVEGKPLQARQVSKANVGAHFSLLSFGIACLLIFVSHARSPCVDACVVTERPCMRMHGLAHLHLTRPPPRVSK